MKTPICDDKVFTTNHFIYKLCGFDLLFKKKKEELENKSKEKGIIRVLFDNLVTDSRSTLREVSDEEFNDTVSDWKDFIYKNAKVLPEPKEPIEDKYKLHIPERMLEKSKTISSREISIVINSDKVTYTSNPINIDAYEYARNRINRKRLKFKYKIKKLKGVKIDTYRKASREQEDKLKLLDKYKILFNYFSINTEVKDWILLDIYTNKGNSLHYIYFHQEGEVFSEAKVINRFIEIVKEITKHNRVKILKIELLSADLEYRFDDKDIRPVPIPKFYDCKNVEKLLTINTHIQIWP